jgi:pimeloyl-ACP methyl ester carboxylesterase
MLLAAAAPLHAADPDTLIIREGLGITLPRRTVTSVINRSPIDPWLIGTRAGAPGQGEAARAADGSEVAWQRVAADSGGWFQRMPPGERYLALTVIREAAGRVIVEGMGHDMLLVNGTLRSGNPYQQADTPDPWEPRFDYSRIPVDLKQGENLLMLRYARGGCKIRLVRVTKPVAFNPRDLTIPDLIIGAATDTWGGIPVINATDGPLKGYSLVSSLAGGKAEAVDVPTVPAMGVRKLAFKVAAPVRTEKGTVTVRLELVEKTSGRRTVVDTVSLSLRVVGPEEVRRETFISAIDGSVQYYAVTPQDSAGFRDRPALFLSLHGAGVEAFSQANSYAPKKWGVLVAATNRRPYGFSWEDWGRLDALEVLEIAKKKFSVDENRVYVTGHSMGGHGTWFMGATYPDKFAAIGPSAGWITFHSYRFTNAPTETSAVKRMLRRSASTSDLFSLVDNYRHFGVYVIHGSADDNVPPQQSYMMLERLKPIHRDYVYYEEPGAGHWWDNSPGPGSDCVDWRPMFDFFARRARPGMDRVRTVDFTTANPGVSSRDAWLAIDAQERQLEISSARLTLDPVVNAVHGATANVARLMIERRALRPGSAATVEIDSQKIDLRLADVRGDGVWFEKQKGTWRQTDAPPPDVKNARRSGTFKEAFRNRMVFVYGTSGTPEENAWAFERARYDAEKLWYQGNGSVDVLRDTEFDPAKEPDRNVILYGNSTTNRLWTNLLSGSPVRVTRDAVEFGGESVKRADVSCFFVRPRAGSETASVGVVSGTGIAGLRLSNLVMYLEPGLGLPDLTVFTSEVLKGEEAGVIISGFFGPDWSMGSGEFFRAR